MTGSAKVILGLSGGVDSAVAGARLLAAGYRVEGLFMKNWEEDDEPGYCAAEADLAMAREVATALGIPLHKANYSADYWDRVFTHFLSEYQAGRTPNPDILCNREVKFRPARSRPKAGCQPCRQRALRGRTASGRWLAPAPRRR